MIYIYSPYRRDETTFTALRVAQAALETANREVFILPNGPKAGVASPFWDTHVLSRINLLPAILSATSIVHVGVDPEYINMIKHYRKTIAKKCTQILVPLWHSTRVDSVAAIQSFFDYCVVPTPTIKKTFTQCVYGKVRTKKLIQMPWDTRMPTTKRKGRVRKNCIKVCVVVDSDAVNNSANFILTALDELLNSHGHLEFTVLHSKSFTPTDKQTIRNLLRDFPARLIFRSMPSLENVATDFHNHDWVWLASRKSNFGTFANLALACGCPVLAWDIAPFNEIIRNDETGVLVPCEVKTNWMQAPAAIHDTSNFVKYAALAFSQEKIFETMAVQSDDTPSKFNDTWCDLLAP